MKSQITILILGIEGMLGSTVYKYFKKKEDYKVIGSSRNKNIGDFFFNLDINQSNLNEYLIEQNIKYVINCIGVRDFELTENYESEIRNLFYVNSIFPKYLANICKKNDTKILSISSNAVFPNENFLKKESHRPNPKTLYGYSKFLGESELSNVLNIRCSIIGPEIKNNKSLGLFAKIEKSVENSIFNGYINHKWNGVTTLEFSILCDLIIKNRNFYKLRNKNSVLHFAFRNPITKYTLIKILARKLKKNIIIKKAYANYNITQLLASEHSLEIFEYFKKSYEDAIEDQINFMKINYEV